MNFKARHLGNADWHVKALLFSPWHAAFFWLVLMVSGNCQLEHASQVGFSFLASS
jgi:hypothetical protein